MNCGAADYIQYSTCAVVFAGRGSGLDRTSNALETLKFGERAGTRSQRPRLLLSEVLGGVKWTLSDNVCASPEMAESNRAVFNGLRNVDPTRTVVVPVYFKDEDSRTRCPPCFG